MRHPTFRSARYLLSLILLSLAWTMPAVAQDTQMTVTKIGIDLVSHNPVIILTNKDSRKSLAITIGSFEATAIALALEGTKTPRPLAHDLMKSVIEVLQAKLDKVLIHNVVDDTFYAKLFLIDSAGNTLEVDARPSDSIALALRTKSPIYVTEFVLEHQPKNSPEPKTVKQPVNVGRTLAPKDKKRKTALELVREGRKIGAAAFTSLDGAFEPFKDTSGDSHRKAIQKYNEAIKLCPDLAQAYAARCIAHHFLRETQAAQKDARIALRLGNLRDQELMLLEAPFQGAESREISRQCMKLAGPDSRLYDHFWQNLARTYWYEGDFANYVKELEAILAWQKAHRRQFTEVTLSSLGSGYEALGNLKRAEEVYKEIDEGDSLVRLYIRQERWNDARAALAQYQAKFESDEKTVFSAGIDELEGKLGKVSPEQMSAAQRLGGGGSYYAFFLGLFQLRDGQAAAGRQTLTTFCESCKSNPREWGITLAWEVRRAEQILQGQ